MRKLILLLAAAVAFSMTAFAQEAGTQGTTGGTETQTTTTTKTTKHTKHAKGESAQAGESSSAAAGGTAAKESQLTGCVAKDATGSGFVLTNARHKKGVEIKSSEDLSAHVGHEVRLMGSWEKPTTDTAAGGAGPKGHQMRTFDVTSVKHISDTCSAGAAAGKKSKGEKTETSKTPGF